MNDLWALVALFIASLFGYVTALIMLYHYDRLFWRLQELEKFVHSHHVSPPERKVDFTN